MSDEFKKLQKLIKNNKVEFRLKRSFTNTFGFWIYWFSETKKPKFVWKTFFIIYWLLSSFRFWIFVSIVLSVLKVNGIYLFASLTPFLIIRLFDEVGQGFIIYDAQNDEALFHLLWATNKIAIMITKTGFIIPSGTRDWSMILDKHTIHQE